MPWWEGERDPGRGDRRTWRFDWDRFDAVAAKYPSIGNLTGEMLDEESMGAVMRSMLALDLEMRRVEWPVGSGWDHRITEADILSAYEVLKDDMLTISAHRERVRT